MLRKGWQHVSPTEPHTLFPFQAAAASEEASTQSVPDNPSEAGEDGAPDDVVDGSGRGGSGGRKEAASGKMLADGKLVKGSGAGAGPENTGIQLPSGSAVSVLGWPLGTLFL